MVRNCCVTNFISNYNAESNAKMFRLLWNSEEMKRWITIIPRNNTPDVKENVVYEANWPQNYHTIIDFGKLHPLDPLLVFDSIKSSLLSFVPSAHKIS